MGIVVVPTFGADPVTITGPTLDAKVSGLATEFNGSIDNDNIKSAAAIANSKLNLASITQNVAHAGTLTMTAKSLDLAKSVDIASATTTTIWATDGNYAHITGTTTITSFGTAAQAGASRTITFDGILTLTHNATSLILPGAANITTAAGDRAIVTAETTANARVIAYIKADGTAVVGNTFTPSVTNALSGSVIQTIYTESATHVSCGATFNQDDTPPLYSEGTLIISNSITPNNASNKIRVTFDAYANGSASNNCIIFMTTGTGATAAINVKEFNQAATYLSLTMTKTFTAGGTGAITVYILGAVTSGALDFTPAANFGDTGFITLTLEEIKA